MPQEKSATGFPPSSPARPAASTTSWRSAPPPADALARRFDDGLARLLRHEPAQYVAGETDFLDFTLRTDARALIPRPETEEWVDALLRRHLGRPQFAAAYRDLPPPAFAPVAPRRVHDVCTGSGCIAVALAKKLPRAVVSASDLSPDAVALARENAARLRAPVNIFRADLLDGLPDAALDILTANPPYITAADCDALSPTVRLHEPRLALDGGPSGLDLISRLANEAPRVLKGGAELWMEIGDDQAAAAETLLCQTNLYKTVRILCDFAGQARLALAIRR